MAHIQKLKEEIDLLERLLELRRQLSAPIGYPPIYVQPYQPWPGYPKPYVGDLIPAPWTISTGTASGISFNCCTH